MSDDLAAKYGFVPSQPAAKPEPAAEDPFAKFGGQKISDEEYKAREKEVYETPLKQVEAFGAGAARGLSFGASDWILKGIGLEKEAAKLQAYNPGLSTAGEVAGTIGGAFVGPGALLAKGAQTATRGITSTVGRIAAKEAIEGGVYGLGQTVSQQALGTPDSVAESLIANVGIGAILGGGVGLAAHGLAEGTKSLTNQVKKVLKGEDAISKYLGDASGYIAEEFAKKPPNIDQIKAIAKAEGIELTPAMLSDSELMRNLESGLAQKPSIFGAKVRKEIAPTFKAMHERSAKIVEEAQDITKYNMGDEFKNEFISRAHKLYDPTSALYSEIEKNIGAIEITPDVRAPLVKNLETWVNKNTNPSNPVRVILAETINDLSADIYMPLSKIKILSSELGGKISAFDNAGDSNVVRLLTTMKNKVDNFFERQVKVSAIENAMTKPEGEKIAAEILSDLKEAKKGWKEFRTFLSEVGGEAGLGKIESFSQFIKKIENIDNERLAENLFDTKSLKSLRFVKENFPDQFDMVRRMEIAKIRAKTLDVNPLGQEVTSVKKLAKEIGKYQPEVAQLIFGKEKLKSIDNLYKLSMRMPSKLGPSGTPQGLWYTDIFKPVMWAADAASYAAYKHGQVLTDVMSNQTKLVLNKVDNFMTGAAKPIVGASTVGLISGTRDYEKRLDHLNQIAMDPNSYINTLEENVKGFAETDPELHQAIVTTGTAASNFLQSKAPKNPFENNVFESKVKWKPSDSQLSQFNRFLKAVDDPYSILDDLSQGLLTPEAVESVRSIYPNIYEKIVRTVMEKIGEHKRELPYAKQLQLSMLLGQPLTASQDANFMQLLQQGAAQEGAKEDMLKAGPKRTKKIEGEFNKGSMSQSEDLIRSRGH